MCAVYAVPAAARLVQEARADDGLRQVARAPGEALPQHRLGHHRVDVQPDTCGRTVSSYLSYCTVWRVSWEHTATRVPLLLEEVVLTSAVLLQLPFSSIAHSRPRLPRACITVALVKAKFAYVDNVCRLLFVLCRYGLLIRVWPKGNDPEEESYRSPVDNDGEWG